MANESPASESSLSSSEKTGPKSEREPKHIYLVPFPKVVFLYPSFIMAIAAGIVTSFAGGSSPDSNSTAVVSISLAFLFVLAANLVVLGFDFPRTTSLTLFFAIFAIIMGLWLLFTWRPDWAPAIRDILRTIRPVANPTFYFFLAGVLGLIFVGVMISVRFNYWEVRGNELVHHRGILSDMVRYPTERLTIEKEIADVFEYCLLRSGNLILTPRDARRPIVLENIVGISKKEKQLARMLGTMDVNVQTN